MKPFVFLDHIDVAANRMPRFGFHPHSGIATLTLLLSGRFSYEDSSGATGWMDAGGVEWMQAGGGVWHRGEGAGERVRGYQLWVALPPNLENAPAESRYLSASRFGTYGPAKVVLGELGSVKSPISAPSPMTLLEVNLRPQEVWRFRPPEGHDVAWLALHAGELRMSEAVNAGQLVVFERSEEEIVVTAQRTSGFVLGSAKAHSHPLIMGNYSIHTSKEALALGESGIERIGADLLRQGKLLQQCTDT